MDPLYSDPVLAEQLDHISSQIAADTESAKQHALVEMEITAEELFDVPDVKVIDTHTYDDDSPKPATPKRKLTLRDSSGAIISAPNSEVVRTPTGALVLATPANKLPPAPAIDYKAIERAKQRKIQFRAKDQQYLDRLSNAFIEQLGELDELKQALALSPNPKAENFLKDLANPKYKAKKWTVSAIAHVNGLSASELASIWRNYNLSKGTLKVINALPEIMQDVVEDARSKNVLCERCDGLKMIERTRKVQNEEGGVTETVEWLDCPACGGVGTVRTAGSSDARKIVTEMAGYTGKKGPLVQQTFVNVHNVANVVDDLEDFQNAPIIDSTFSEH